MIYHRHGRVGLKTYDKKNASSVLSGSYAVTCQRLNHNIYSIGWNVPCFLTEGLRSFKDHAFAIQRSK